MIGISGGLDSRPTHCSLRRAPSTHLGLPRKNILAFTLPGFATTEEHKGQCVGADATRWARPAKRSTFAPRRSKMLEDLGHPFAKGEKTYDVTFENVQAGLRTDYLFRLANQRKALVMGTGDLSGARAQGGPRMASATT